MSVHTTQAVSEVILVFYETISLVVSQRLTKKLEAVIKDDDLLRAVMEVFNKEIGTNPRKLLMEAESNVNERLKSNRSEVVKSTSTKAKSGTQNEYEGMQCDIIPKVIKTMKNEKGDPCPHSVIALVEGKYPRCLYHKRSAVSASSSKSKVSSKADLKNKLNGKSGSSKRNVVEDSESESSNNSDRKPKKASKSKDSKATARKKDESESESESVSDNTRSKKTSSSSAKADIDKRKSNSKDSKSSSRKKDESDNDDSDEDVHQKHFSAKLDNKNKQIFPTNKQNPSSEAHSKNTNTKDSDASDTDTAPPPPRRNTRVAASKNDTKTEKDKRADSDDASDHKTD